MNKLTGVALCGLTGVGKSTIVNMLIQGDIFRDENKCQIGDDATGVTKELEDYFNDKFRVFDTSGLGELPSGSVPHNEAINQIRNYFSENKCPLNYICYVKDNRTTKEDVECFKIFQKIFKGGEKNFVIIVTKTGTKWANNKNNVKSINKNFGNYPIISVGFPLEEDDEDECIDNYKAKRAKSLTHLLEELSKLEYESIKLEVLSPSQNVENDLSRYFINFVPIVGSVYQLTASGIYYASGKPTVAKKRLMDGATGLVLDAAGGGLGVGKPAMAAIAVGSNLTVRGVKAIVEYVRE